MNVGQSDDTERTSDRRGFDSAAEGTESGESVEGTESADRERSGSDRPRRPRRRRRWHVREVVLLIVAIILSAIILTGIYFVISTAIVAKEVKAAANTVSSLSSTSLTDGTATEKLSSAVSELDKHVGIAYANTSNPVWRIMSGVPLYGGNVKAICTTVDTLHDISHKALPLMLDAVDGIDMNQIGIKDSTISVPGVKEASTKLAKANAIVQQANAKFQSIDGVTIRILSNELSPAQKQLDKVAKTTDTLSKTMQLLPSMLGLDNPNESRTYLILAQGNAELRATGGVSGSWGTVTVANGRITLNDFVSEGELAVFDSPVTKLTDDELALYGYKMGSKPQDVNFTPDFRRTGTIAKTMWERRFGQHIDGVISIDPVFLQKVMSVVGSVQVTYNDYSPVLDGQSVSRVLLNEVYAALPDVNDQDAFFSLAAKTVFDHMLHIDSAQSTELVKQLTEAARNGHVYVWSANDGEQKLLDDSGVGGVLVTAKSGKYMGGSTPKQVIGVYFNDAMGSKMDWYLERKVTDNIVRTYANGSEQHEITISLRNTLSKGDVGKIPGYVVGALEHGAQAGDIQLINYLYAPAGGSIPQYEAGPDAEKGDNYNLHDGLTVISKQVNLKPGESYEIKAIVYTAPGSLPGETVLRQTPLIE